MNTLLTILIIVAIVLSLAIAAARVVGAVVAWRRDRRFSPLVRFVLAKGCLSLAGTAVLVCVLLGIGSGWVVIPIAFVVFVGGSRLLSLLAKRVPPDAFEPQPGQSVET